jgi:hypothetical protein
MIDEAEKLLMVASENFQRGRWPNDDLERLWKLVENIRALYAQRRWLEGLPPASNAIN